MISYILLYLITGCYLAWNNYDKNCSTISRIIEEHNRYKFYSNEEKQILYNIVVVIVNGIVLIFWPVLAIQSLFRK